MKYELIVLAPFVQRSAFQTARQSDAGLPTVHVGQNSWAAGVTAETGRRCICGEASWGKWGPSDPPRGPRGKERQGPPPPRQQPEGRVRAGPGGAWWRVSLAALRDSHALA